jgi:Calcium binding
MARPKKIKKRKQDEIREERILMEIVVDAYNEEERAMGWYCYLEDTLHFPFLTRCISERPISPLQAGDEVEVVGMGPQDECEKEMFVEIRLEQKRSLAVPLSQLEVVRGDEATKQAVADWDYWVGMGYEF